MLSSFSAIKPKPTLINHKPKICIDCKFYIKQNNFFISNEFGKCSLFPYECENDYYLVNGLNNEKDEEYYHCSTARKYEDMCGREGKFYEKK